MERKINSKKKGVSDVKSDATILHTPNAFDVRGSRVAKSKKAEWSDFLMFENESCYTAPKLTKERAQQALQQARRVLGRAAMVAAH